MYQSFRPGKFLYDTEGKLVQAHGGSILFLDGTYYWYGENKEGITGNATGEPCPYWHHGVRLYSSKDLYNWKDEGCIVKESEDPENPFHPSRIMDRPHILFNEKTRQYVLYAKTSGKDFGAATFSVCKGDSLFSLSYVHDLDLGEFHAGDFDLFLVDGEAYIVFENPHDCMVLAKLTDDYLSIIPGSFERHIEKPFPPYTREAPAHFEKDGRHYLLTSGTTGYFPNASRVYDITDLHGHWVDLGDPCMNDIRKNSFHSQFSSVFRDPRNPDLYIALGDRWLIDLVEDLPDMDAAFVEMFDPANQGKPMTLYAKNLSDDNTSLATYVWLPVCFDSKGIPFIQYHREWTKNE
ncbi:MAG: family 43 glycosylhydrolase [Candidatus Enteromonas sp.]